MSNLLTMVESGSIMLLSVLVVSTIQKRFSEPAWFGSTLLGLLFTVVGMVVMENSVEIVPGIRTDPRAAVVVLSAAFGGPASVAITASCLAIVRMMYGGLGAGPGATYILGVGIAAGLIWYYWFYVARRGLNIRYIIIQAVVAGTVPTVILIFASKAPWDVFLTSNAFAAPTNFVATLIIGVMLVRDRDHMEAIDQRQEKQDQIDAISEHAPVALFQIVRDDDGAPRFTYLSRATERIIELQPEELYVCFRNLDGISDENVIGQIYEKLQESEDDFAPWDLEIACQRSRNEKKWIRLYSGIRLDRDGRPVWDGSIVDITEQKVSEQLKDEFISTVSHELRTPLTSIRGALGLVIGSSSEQLPPKILGMLEIANRNAERLVLLINDILDMQKIRSGQMEFKLEQQAVRPLLDQAIASAESYAPEKNIRFVLEDHAPESEANIDPGRLTQVISNILSNAIKFSPSEETIKLSILQVDDRLRISIKDSGPGIPADFHNKIFDPFSQSEQSTTRKVGGTGLGLSISKALVEAMGGELWFESIERHGAIFHVDLPAVVTDPAVALQSEKKDRRVLVYSNDAKLMRTASKVVDLYDLTADIIGHFDSVLALARKHQYQAIILDAAASSTSSLIDRLRKISELRNLPIVVVIDEGAGSITPIQTGVTVISRPFDKLQLQRAMKKVISSYPEIPHILYVEDDLSLHDIFQQAFGDDLRMTGAKTLAEARVSMSMHVFDLVLLDLELPDGSGIKLLDRIPRSTPVIVFSAYDVPPDIIPRVKAVMTKSRVKEADVVEAVFANLREYPVESSARSFETTVTMEHAYENSSR